MNRFRIIVFTVLIIVVLSTAALVVSAAQSNFSGQKWEYIYMLGSSNAAGFIVLAGNTEETQRLQTSLNEITSIPDPSNTPKSFNALGAEGGELVSAQNQLVQGDTVFVFIFKRPVQ